VAQVLTWLLSFLAFLVIYAYLIRRRRGQGELTEVHWGWVLATAACAGLALLLSYLL
jgi:hypothetical protein